MATPENQIYQHFKESEQEFVSQTLDQINQVQTTHVPLLTAFLNPRERYIVQTLVNSFDDIKYAEHEEFAKFETTRAIIYPYYLEEPDIEDYEISLIEIHYPQKFSKISHGQILGSILGAGIVRDRLGDIITDGERWQFLVDTKLKDFLLQQVDRIGRTTVELESKELSKVVEPEDTGIAMEIVVRSTRIDNVIARSFNLSRNIAQEFVQKNRVKVNWVEETNPAEAVENEDILSVRGKGRLRIGEIKNRTRKDNIVLKIIKYDRNKK